MKTTTAPSFKPILLSLLAAGVAATLGGCALSPAYHVPATPAPAVYKEAQDWLPAAPADTLERGPWWELFGDPILNKLASAVEVDNQNVALAVANYAQARALVAEQRAALFPSVDLSAGATRSGAGSASNPAGSGSTVGNQYRTALGASWEPDIWGKLRAGVTGASASAQASAADLAAARLSAQGELVTDYIALRRYDAQIKLLTSTADGYQRVLTITQNQFSAGIAAKSDVLQAQTQVDNARIAEITAERQRATMEHAIAVLLGKAPAEFTLAAGEWQIAVPDVPLGLPSTLLQRRPDIAAAERRVAVANEQIGIARAAYFPDISLSASYGYGASKVGGLFNASNNAWSLGMSAAQTIFDAGAIAARVTGAEAGRDAAIAQYRQTVLAAFANVEDELTATRALMRQQDLYRAASEAADQVEVQLLNRYRAGQVSYTDVVTAQNTALSARNALVQAQSDRQTTAVALIQSLGGGWHAGQ